MFGIQTWLYILDGTGSDPVKQGTVRLAGSAQPYEGRVEVFLLGQWGTLTDYYINRWDLSHATFICQQLGYPGAAAMLNRVTDVFQLGTGVTWTFNAADCIGDDVNFTQCSRSLRANQRPQTEALGVICTG